MACLYKAWKIFAIQAHGGVVRSGDKTILTEFDGFQITTADELYQTVWDTYSDQDIVRSPISGIVVEEAILGEEELDEETVVLRIRTDNEKSAEELVQADARGRRLQRPRKDRRVTNTCRVASRKDRRVPRWSSRSSKTSVRFDWRVGLEASYGDWGIEIYVVGELIYRTYTNMFTELTSLSYRIVVWELRSSVCEQDQHLAFL